MGVVLWVLLLAALPVLYWHAPGYIQGLRGSQNIIRMARSEGPATAFERAMYLNSRSHDEDLAERHIELRAIHFGGTCLRRFIPSGYPPPDWPTWLDETAWTLLWPLWIRTDMRLVNRVLNEALATRWTTGRVRVRWSSL